VSTNKDLYAILGVLPDAEQEVIRAVYLALAKKYHPDSSGNADGAEKLKEINAAYEVLSDPAKRKAYDATRPEDKDATGDYEPDIDDEDLSVDDYKDDWEFAVEYQPELANLLREVATISPTLSIVFQSTILSKKAFNAAHEIKAQLISDFLKRFFGKSEDIQLFAKALLNQKKMAAANELNRAVRIFGDEINSTQLISQIREKHHVLEEFFAKDGYFVYRGFPIVKMGNIYKIHNEEMQEISGCPNFIGVDAAKLYIRDNF
jgi:curved DNA-binding protein CbpA